MKQIYLLLGLLVFSFNSSSLADSSLRTHSVDKSRSKRPIQEAESTPPSVWNLWGAKEKLLGAYDDTITWDIDLVFGKKAIDNFGKAVLEFLTSPEGKRFIFRNKKTFLVNQLEDTAEFENSFWNDFNSWSKEKRYQVFFDDQFISAINLLPRQPRLNIKAFYPQSPIRGTVSRGVDHIQYLLADDMAQTMRIGRFAPQMVANSIRRAARGEAVLAAVQNSYNQSRNSLTNRIVNLIEVLAKKLVHEGARKSKLDIEVELSITPWEKTEGFKKNPTFPIRSYFYAKNAPKAIVPYQVTKFLDSLDTYDFEKDIKRLGN